MGCRHGRVSEAVFSPGLRKIISLAVARTHHQNSAHMLSQQHATRATAKRAASSPRQSRIICSHSDMLRVLYSNLRLLAAVCCSDTSVGASRQPQFHGSTLARSRSGSLAPHETEPCSHAQLTFAHLEKPRTKLRTREWPPWHSGCEPAKPQRTKRRRMRCHALHSAEPQPAESAARRQWARPAVRCSRESPARVPAPPGCSLHRADHRRPLEPPLSASTARSPSVPSVFSRPPRHGAAGSGRPLGRLTSIETTRRNER